MKKFIALIGITGLSLAPACQAHESDDPVLTKLMLDQLEWRGDTSRSESQTAVEGETWIGKDLSKFWLKFDAQYQQSEFGDAEIQALYSHAIAPYWDLQVGLRQDIKPSPQQTWGVIGVKGLAPYFFDIDAAFFVGESGATGLRFAAEYELLFTQKLVLSPDIKLNFYGQNQPENDLGAGLSDIDFGLRLRYEITREFAPYFGYSWSKKYGATANYARLANEPASDNQWVIGIRAWY